MLYSLICCLCHGYFFKKKSFFRIKYMIIYFLGEIMHEKYILHVDMDAFFASIEQRDNPEYRNKPLIVGGKTRGVVSTCSYEARKFGVRSAMPIFEAKRKCPQGIFITPRGKVYHEVSQQIYGILQNYSPLVEMASVDEAYLDITGLENLFGPPLDIAHALQEEIYTKTNGLTCSIGIAPVKFLAKIASDEKKPHGIFMISYEEMPVYLRDLSIAKIPGVGKRFLEELKKLGIKKCADVFCLEKTYWEQKFGKAGIMLYERASGIDDREVEPYTERKSESAETTLAENVTDKAILKKWLLVHAERVGTGLRKQNLKGRTINIKIKFADFKQITRQLTLDKQTNATDTIYQKACLLLDDIVLAKPVRLIGLGVSGFEELIENQQLSLFSMLEEKEEPKERIEEKRNHLDAALDELREKYGKSAVIRGKLFSKD